MEEFIKNLRAKEIHLAIDAVDMIEYLKANPYVLDAIQGHYDDLARKRLSIFDPDRAVKDIEAMALDAFQGGNNRSFCNTEPSAPIVQVTRDPSHKLVQITVLPKGGHGQGKSDLENYFHHVHNSTELIGNSKMYAGLLGRAKNTTALSNPTEA